MARAAPLISVIVPHFNQPKQLQNCLASLHNQSFNLDCVEFIVVDNDSKECPTKICAQFPHVRLEREVEPGPGPARNRGVMASHGAILAFIDADCTADHGWLAAIASKLNESSKGKIIGGDVRIALVNSDRPTLLEAYESIFAYRQQEYIERYGFSGTGNLAMPRAIYDTVGPFAGMEVAEDRDWGRRATQLGYYIVFEPSMVVFHPARTSFDDLYAKWDRHIAHELADRAQGLIPRLCWAVRALAIASSPAFETPRILNSTRVSTWRERCLAALALLRIRFYRARRMLAVLLRPNQTRFDRSWNRG